MKKEFPGLVIFTLSWTMYPVTIGLMIPGMVPIVLEIPIRMAAYLKK